jgi:hypothetical protein
LLVDRKSLRFGGAFGEGVYQGTAVVETLELKNGGQAPLVVSSLSYSGDSCFALWNTMPIVPGQGLSNTLVSGSIGVISVGFTAGPALTSCSGSLTINSNAANAPILVIPLSATAAPAP